MGLVYGGTGEEIVSVKIVGKWVVCLSDVRCDIGVIRFIRKL